MSVTLAQWLAQTKLPRLEARMLAEQATGWSRVQLLTRADEPLDTAALVRLDALAQRRLNGEPLAYILGEREFYGRRFAVSPAVLIPRPETEHLLEAALQKLPENGRLWDLGTGSGAIAVSVGLERTDLTVQASDISTAALDVARRNAQDLGAQIAFAHGSWFDITAYPNAAASGSISRSGWDVLVSNPPYIERSDAHLSQGDLRFEPQHALTDFADGLSCIRVLAAGAPSCLKTGGWLMVEHGFDQGEAVRAIFAANGFTDIETQRDLAGLERLTIGRSG